MLNTVEHLLFIFFCKIRKVSKIVWLQFAFMVSIYNWVCVTIYFKIPKYIPLMHHKNKIIIFKKIIYPVFF